MGVCRGRYAEALRGEWHAWDTSHGSENEPVDCFEDEQLFVVFVVADGGSDLEHFAVRSFEEARSILLQVPCQDLKPPKPLINHWMPYCNRFRFRLNCGVTLKMFIQ